MRRYFMVGLLALVLFAGTGCGSKDKDYSFPLGQEDLEQALAENKLQWQVVDSQLKTEIMSSFTLEDENGIQVFLVTASTESERRVELAAARFARFGKREEFFSKHFSRLIEMVGGFYGSAKEAGKVYQEFLAYAPTRNWELQWSKRVGDNHYNFNFTPYGSVSMTIDNSDSYKRSQAAEATQMTKELGLSGIPAQAMTVRQVSAVAPDAKREQFYIVSGRLEDIRQVKESPNPELHPDDFHRASLSDETGKLDVFFYISSLTAKELADKRDHYMIFYPGESPYYLIYVSPAVE